MLLRNDLPDGSQHFDWLLARNDTQPLLTFRLECDISLDDRPFEGERLTDHRRVYLAYEGPITGDRGSVTRVAQGWCDIRTESDHAIDLWVAIGARNGNLRGIRQENGRFLFGFV